MSDKIHSDPEITQEISPTEIKKIRALTKLRRALMEQDGDRAKKIMETEEITRAEFIDEIKKAVNIARELNNAPLQVWLIANWIPDLKFP